MQAEVVEEGNLPVLERDSALSGLTHLPSRRRGAAFSLFPVPRSFPAPLTMVQHPALAPLHRSTVLSVNRHLRSGLQTRKLHYGQPDPRYRRIAERYVS